MTTTNIRLLCGAVYLLPLVLASALPNSSHTRSTLLTSRMMSMLLTMILTSRTSTKMRHPRKVSSH